MRHSDGIPENIFSKNVDLEKKISSRKKTMQNYPAGKVNSADILKAATENL